jgi:hypothetical protein
LHKCQLLPSFDQVLLQGGMMFFGMLMYSTCRATVI